MSVTDENGDYREAPTLQDDHGEGNELILSLAFHTCQLRFLYILVDQEVVSFDQLS